MKGIVCMIYFSLHETVDFVDVYCFVHIVNTTIVIKLHLKVFLCLSF